MNSNGFIGPRNFVVKEGTFMIYKTVYTRRARNFICACLFESICAKFGFCRRIFNDFNVFTSSLFPYLVEGCEETLIPCTKERFVPNDGTTKIFSTISRPFIQWNVKNYDPLFEILSSVKFLGQFWLRLANCCM